MKIQRFVCGPIVENGYVIYQDKGGSAYIIDPGYSAGLYRDFVDENKLTVKAILLTHHHPDHAGKAEKLAGDFDVKIWAHRNELPYAGTRIDEVFEGGETLDLDGEEIKVLLTPGHSAGGVCFLAERSKVCFTGDTVFDVDTGRIDLPGGSGEEMRRSMRDVVDKWPNDITIYPGHGDPATMKFVREENDEFNWYLEN
jgi:glyoxylase-like metal-dependent hydrolase (beta-lactamase superfamily II)